MCGLRALFCENELTHCINGTLRIVSVPHVTGDRSAACSSQFEIFVIKLEGADGHIISLRRYRNKVFVEVNISGVAMPIFCDREIVGIAVNIISSKEEHDSFVFTASIQIVLTLFHQGTFIIIAMERNGGRFPSPLQYPSLVY